MFRILDAAINRAGEGIRVVEDYVRMVVGDAYLSEQLKQLRHDVTDAVSGIDPAERIAARDSNEDVGRTIQIESEYERDGLNDQSGASTRVRSRSMMPKTRLAAATPSWIAVCSVATLFRG